MKGSITIYFTLIFTVILSLLCTTIEGARYKTIYTKTRNKTILALDSVMASYCKELFEDYGLMFYIDDEPEKEIKDQIESARGLYQAEIQSIEVVKTYAYEENGLVFANEVIDNMKYIVPKQVIEEILNKIGIFSSNEKESPIVDIENGEKITDNMSDLAESINKQMEKIKKQKGDPKEYIHVLFEVVSQAEEKINNNTSIPGKLSRRYKKTKAKLNKYVDKLIPMLEKLKKDMDHLESEKEKTNLEFNDVVFPLESTQNDLFAKNKKIVVESLESLQDIKRIISRVDSNLSHNNLDKIKEDINTMDDALKNYTLSSLTFNKKEEKHDSVVDYIANVVKNGKLGLVIPDTNKISAASVIMDTLPSQMVQLEKVNSKNNFSITDRILYSQYLVTYFGNYVSKKRNTVLTYELEYLLSGKENDKDNLSKTVDKLILSREGFNLLHILRDSEKRQESKIMAAAIVGWTGIAFLVYMTQFLIMTAWAMGESILDVKTLLSGGKINIIKSKKDWNLSLSQLGSLGKKTNTKNNEKGLSYVEYLQCLLMFEENETLWFRTMDLIQLNMQKRYNQSFEMLKCIHGMKINISFLVPPVFIKMPITNLGNYTYEMTY